MANQQQHASSKIAPRVAMPMPRTKKRKPPEDRQLACRHTPKFKSHGQFGITSRKCVPNKQNERGRTKTGKRSSSLTTPLNNNCEDRDTNLEAAISLSSDSDLESISDFDITSHLELDDKSIFQDNIAPSKKEVHASKNPHHASVQFLRTRKGKSRTISMRELHYQQQHILNKTIALLFNAKFKSKLPQSIVEAGISTQRKQLKYGKNINISAHEPSDQECIESDKEVRHKPQPNRAQPKTQLSDKECVERSLTECGCGGKCQLSEKRHKWHCKGAKRTYLNFACTKCRDEWCVCPNENCTNVLKWNEDNNIVCTACQLKNRANRKLGKKRIHWRWHRCLAKNCKALYVFNRGRRLKRSADKCGMLLR